MNKKYLVCFDVGNVLVRLGRSVRSSVQPTDQEELGKLLKIYGLGQITSDLFFEKLGQLITDYDNVALKRNFINERILGPQIGAAELLRHLHENSVPVAILSNTNEAHWNYLKTLHLFDFCDYIILSFQQQCAKPDRTIYEALEVASGYKSREIIFFDDLLENVATAHTLGWNAIQVNPLTSIVDINQHLIIHEII